LTSKKPDALRQIHKVAAPWIQLISKLVQGVARHSQLPLTVGTETRDGSSGSGLRAVIAVQLNSVLRYAGH